MRFVSAANSPTHQLTHSTKVRCQWVKGDRLESCVGSIPGGAHLQS